jgi:molecular chaperone HscB
MNYFDFYTIPITFKVDAAALRQTFYANSKKHHPDFFTMESVEKQAEILELSTLNTQAYKTLSDFDRRMKYILELKGIMAEEGKNTIPQDFLMDMMDINEALMELEFDFDPEAHKKVLTDVELIENQLFTDIQPLIENYQNDTNREGVLEEIKKYYLKKRYLLRIRENLTKFATLLK